MIVGVLRGGVPVAAEVAYVLGAPLELCVVRKVFYPGSPSFAIGAVAEGDAICLDAAEIAKLQLPRAAVQHAVDLERAEVARLGETLRDIAPLPVSGRDAVVVDDAIASLDTLRAAAPVPSAPDRQLVLYHRHRHPSRGRRPSPAWIRGNRRHLGTTRGSALHLPGPLRPVRALVLRQRAGPARLA